MFFSMSNISKNLLLALTLLCVIVLIIFCVELFLINRGTEPGGQSPAAAVDPPTEENEPDPTTEDPPGGDVNGNGNQGGTGDNGPGDGAPRPPPQGERHELPITEDMKLVVYAREELFDYAENELDWWFIYTGGIATLEISFAVISPHGVAADAETFLNNYTGGDDSVFGGEEQIKGSSLRGYYVSANVDGEIYEAWIHSLPNSDFALIFVINFENDQQKEALYEVLGTIDIMAPVFT
jgi:hypothetical protein